VRLRPARATRRSPRPRGPGPVHLPGNTLSRRYACSPRPFAGGCEICFHADNCPRLRRRFDRRVEAACGPSPGSAILLRASWRRTAAVAFAGRFPHSPWAGRTCWPCRGVPDLLDWATAAPRRSWPAWSVPLPHPVQQRGQPHPRLAPALRPALRPVRSPRPHLPAFGRPDSRRNDLCPRPRPGRGRPRPETPGTWAALRGLGEPVNRRPGLVLAAVGPALPGLACAGAYAELLRPARVCSTGRAGEPQLPVFEALAAGPACSPPGWDSTGGLFADGRELFPYRRATPGRGGQGPHPLRNRSVHPRRGRDWPR
jgi:hypothetical protein